MKSDLKAFETKLTYMLDHPGEVERHEFFALLSNVHEQAQMPLLDALCACITSIPNPDVTKHRDRLVEINRIARDAICKTI